MDAPADRPPAPLRTGPRRLRSSRSTPPSRVPGSKSLTNRYLVLAALADGPSRLRAPLHSRDSALMIDALRQLGADITRGAGRRRLRPRPGGHARSACRLRRRRTSPSTAAWPAPSCASFRRWRRCAAVPSVFDGDPHARKRPMGTIIEALAGLGVTVSGDPTADTASSLPFRVDGTGEVRGGHLVIDASASSQFVSALLLVGARVHRRPAPGTQPEQAAVPSLDHINMTVAVLRGVGVAVDDSASRTTGWSPPARSAPSTSGSSRTCPTPARSSPRPWPPAAPCGSRTGPPDTTQVGDLWREHPHRPWAPP